MRDRDRDIEAGIKDLLDLLPGSVRSVVEGACRENLRLYPQPERSSFRVNDRVHRYGPNETKICDGGRGPLVFDEMCKDGRCSAPTYSQAAIYQGKIETLFPFNDLVVKLVNPQERSVYNVTLPKHIFFPGVVKLVVMETSAITAVAVSGQGKGNWMLPNTTFGPLLFKTILHKYLVPRVEQQIQALVGGPAR